MRRMGTGADRAVVVITVFSALSGGLARGGEIESYLERGIPASLDTAADVQQARASRAYPLLPLVRLPFYGLPYDLVDLLVSTRYHDYRRTLGHEQSQ